MTHTGPTLDTHGDYTFIDCEPCGFIHADPLPSERELETFYRSAFYADEKPNYFSDYMSDLDWWLMHFEWRLNEMRRLSPTFVGRTLIDIGTGPGIFLEAARRNNFPALGIEPSQAACAFARTTFSVNVVHDFLTESNWYNLPNCEAIHMHEVLEHVRDPRWLLQICHNLLKWNGVLCICVPNDYSPWQATLGTKHFLASPEHLNYFTPQSLMRLVESVGLTPVRVIGSFPMELFPLMGDDYITTPDLGRTCHLKRKKFETNFHASGRFDDLMALYESNIVHGVGREILLFATKQQ